MYIKRTSTKCTKIRKRRKDNIINYSSGNITIIIDELRVPNLLLGKELLYSTDNSISKYLKESKKEQRHCYRSMSHKINKR